MALCGGIENLCKEKEKTTTEIEETIKNSKTLICSWQGTALHSVSTLHSLPYTDSVTHLLWLTVN